MPPLPVLWIVGTLLLIAGWADGEVRNRQRQRMICGPLAALAIVVGAAAIASVYGSRGSYSRALQLSKAANSFTQALEDAIDRGETEAAHQELRRYNAESIDTYEPGTVLKQFQELNALSDNNDPPESVTD